MNKYNPYITNDGSVGLYSTETEDIYHSVTGALTESYEKFILPANIESLLKTKSEIKLLDICFGIGYNSKSFLNFILEKFKNFYNNYENVLSVNIDKIYTNNTQGKYIDKKYADKNFNNSYNNSICIDKVDTNKNYKENLKNQHEYSACQKIFVNGIDIDKNLAMLSPFVLTGINKQKNLNKSIKNIKLKKILKKYENKNNYENELINESFLSFNDSKFKSSKKPEYSKGLMLKLFNILASNYPNEFFSNEFKSLLLDNDFKPFLSSELILIYKILYYYKDINNPLRGFLSFLHNIYYMYLSNRYKNDLECLKMLDIDFVLNLMDARLALESDKNTYDIVFLDGFTPSKSPSLWSYDFIKLLTEHLNDNSVILTYTSAAPVRNAFLSCDLNVGNIISKNNEIIGTIASKNKNLILNELSEFDLGLVKTKSGIMYLDKNLSASDEEILSDRNQRVLSSNLVSASSYKRHYDKP